VLLLIAMPLKYWADLPYAVTLVGTIHGWIVMVYLAAILYAQISTRWNVVWSLLSLLAAFVPLGNFILERVLKRKQEQGHFTLKPIPLVWLVYAIILFTFLDLFTQLPVMSTYATSLGASSMIAGFIVGMYSLTNTFGNVLAGVFTDRLGANVILKAGLLLTSFSLLLYNFVDSVQLLLIVRFLHGFLGGLIVPAAFTYMANQTKTEKQGSQSAITGSFVGIAAIIGPAYSGIMASRTSVPFVFTTVAMLGVMLFVLSVFFLRSNKRGKTDRARAVRKLELNSGMVRAFLGAFFLMFSQGALAYLLPQHVESLGYNSRLSGMLMSIFGVVAVIIFALPTNKLFDRLQPIRSFSIGLSLMGISQLLISQSASASVLYAVMTLYGLGFAFLFPAINTLLAHSTTKENRGQAYGIFYALFSAGTVAGSSGLGLLPVTFEHQFIVTGCALLTCVAGVMITARLAGERSESMNA
jgi:integral membrane protein